MNPSVLSQVQPQQSTQPAQPDAVFDVPGESNGVPTHSGNWLTHLLPTLGSVAAPIIGGLLAPETGGLSLLAAAGLSGAGAAAGKAAENGTEGKQVFNGSDLTAGAEGLAGGVAGGLAGKALGKGAEMLGNRAGNITKAATDATDTANADKATLDAANSIKDNFGSISPKLQGGDHLALGTNQKILDGLGYDSTDPYQMAKASEAGYHPTDLSLNSVYDEALQGAKPVDMSGFSNGVYKTMQNTGTTDLSTSPLGKALTDFNTKTEGKYGTDTGVNLPDNMAATDVRKLQQAIGREQGHQQTIINNADNLGQPNAQAEAAHNTLSNLYDELGSKIKTPEVDASIAARTTTPEERAALVDKFGDTHGNQIADTIDNAKGADDLLGPMKNYTQMSKASRMAIDDLENVTAGPRAIARTKAELAPDEVPQAATPTLADAAGHVVNNGSHGILSTVAKAGIHASQNPAVLNTLSRLGKLTAKIAPAAGAAIGTAPNLGADPTLGGTMGAMNLQQQSLPAQPGQTNPNDLQSYINAIQAQSILAPSLGGGATSFMSSIAPMLQKNQLLGSELNAIPGGFANAGGAQGTGGILSRLSGLIPGTAAHTYQTQQDATAAQLAQALGISPQAAAGLLPQLMQNQQSAGIPQGILSQLQGQLVQ